MNDIIPNILEQTIFKKQFAKNYYNKLLLPKVKRYNTQFDSSEKLKNILSINTAVGKGGAAKVAHEFLTKNLLSNGYNAKTLVTTSYSELDEHTCIIPQSNPKLHKTLHKASRSLGWLDFFNPNSFNILQMEIFKKADLIHLHNLHGAYFSLFLLPELTTLKPTIWTLHDEQSFTGHCSYSFNCDKWQTGCGKCPDLKYYPKLKKDTTDFLLQTKEKIYELSKFTLVCPSNWLANKVSKSVLGNKDIRVIYNGIDEKIFKPTCKNKAREILNLPQDKKILLFSASGGMKNPQKGGKYLLEVFEQFKNEPNIIFLNLGGASAIEANNWIDIPYVNDEKTMALYYSAADLFIYPSLVEAFGLVAAEALACETPVITFDYSALPEIVDDEVGYLADYKNSNDLVYGINLYLQDELRINSAGILGRKKILDKFTQEKMLESYISLYKEIYDSRYMMS